MCLATSKGHIRAEFKKIRIPHPRLDAAYELFDDLREAKRREPGGEQDCGLLLADSHSGKSMSVTTYIENRIVPYVMELGIFAPGTKPATVAKLQKKVIHVTLSAPASPMSLATDLLTALGDPNPELGTLPWKRRRIYKHIVEWETELIAIDEIQHLSSATSLNALERSGLADKKTMVVQDNLKKYLIDGMVPLMFIGTPIARDLIFSEDQVKFRGVPELDFSRLSFFVQEQREIFTNFLGTLGGKLWSHGLFERQSNFFFGDIPALVHIVSGGRIGVAAKLIRAAAEAAFTQKATAVERIHLEMAVDSWAIPLKLVSTNPFRDGPSLDSPYLEFMKARKK